jgi:signal transduction histidine kinase
MLNALLAYSRVSTSHEQPEAVSLNGVLAEVVSDLEVRIEETGGRVEVGDLPTLQAERSQMRQLFQNLVSNALKFHREGVPPVVKVYTSADSSKTVEVRVEDNGIGFDEVYLEKVFQPFTRLHGRSEYEGSGIGLAICRKIIERHGGSLTATSQEGQGSTFIIQLPK